MRQGFWRNKQAPATNAILALKPATAATTAANEAPVTTYAALADRMRKADRETARLILERKVARWREYPTNKTGRSNADSQHPRRAAMPGTPTAPSTSTPATRRPCWGARRTSPARSFCTHCTLACEPRWTRRHSAASMTATSSKRWPGPARREDRRRASLPDRRHRGPAVRLVRWPDHGRGHRLRAPSIRSPTRPPSSTRPTSDS